MGVSAEEMTPCGNCGHMTPIPLLRIPYLHLCLRFDLFSFLLAGDNPFCLLTKRSLSVDIRLVSDQTSNAPAHSQ